MFEMSALQTEEVSGGFSWNAVIAGVNRGIGIAQAYVTGIGAVGQTLSNYYGEDMTLEIIAAGNMSA